MILQRRPASMCVTVASIASCVRKLLLLLLLLCPMHTCGVGVHAATKQGT